MERHMCSWIGRLNIIKMSILLKLICRLNAIPTKIPAMFFCTIRPANSKMCMEKHNPKETKTILKKKKKLEANHPTQY